MCVPVAGFITSVLDIGTMHHLLQEINDEGGSIKRPVHIQDKSMQIP